MLSHQVTRRLLDDVQHLSRWGVVCSRKRSAPLPCESFSYLRQRSMIGNGNGNTRYCTVEGYTLTHPPLTCTPCQRDEPQAQRSHQASLHPAHHLRIITGAGSNPAAEGSPLKDHHHCSSKIPTQKMPTAERGQTHTTSDQR